MIVQDREGWIRTLAYELVEEAIFRVTQAGLQTIVKRAGPKSLISRAAGFTVPVLGATVLTADVVNTVTYLEREHQAFSRPGPPGRIPVQGTFPIYQIGGLIV